MAQTGNVVGGMIFPFGTRIFQDFTLHSGVDFLDPTGLEVWVTRPDKTVLHLIFGTDPEITKLDTGHYRFTLVPLQAGMWLVHVGASNPVKVIEWGFRVSQSNVGA